MNLELGEKNVKDVFGQLGKFEYGMNIGMNIGMNTLESLLILKMRMGLELCTKMSFPYSF